MVTKKSETEDTNTKKPREDKEILKRVTRASSRTTAKKVIDSPIRKKETKTIKKEVPPSNTKKPAPKKAPAAKAAPKKVAPKRKTESDEDEFSDTEETTPKKQKTAGEVIASTNDLIPVQTAPLADVMTLGSGEVGQLGLGKAILGRKRPTPLPELQTKHILKLIPGGLHNAVIVQNNPQKDPTDTSVWTWGCNDNAVLGRSTPVQDDEDIDLSMNPDISPALEGKHIVDVSTGEYRILYAQQKQNKTKQK